MRYCIVKCPKCKNIFITSAKKRVRCRVCNRSFKVLDNMIRCFGNLNDAVNFYEYMTREVKIIRF